VGIRILLGIEKTEEDDLIEKINYHTGLTSSLQIELERLRYEKEKARIKANKQKELSEKELLKELSRKQAELKRVNPARELWR